MVTLKAHLRTIMKCSVDFSIRNNSGCLASEVAIMCGHEECAKYLDAATKRQETELSEAKGVYQVGPDKHAITTPSPHDITVPHKVEPCVIMQGLNGGRLPPAGPGDDNMCDDMECEMETESRGTLNTKATSLPQNIAVHCKTDVTLSSKDVVVAGRKRAREDTDDVDFKRMRRSGMQLLFPSYLFSVTVFFTQLDARYNLRSDHSPEVDLIYLQTDNLTVLFKKSENISFWNYVTNHTFDNT